MTIFCITGYSNHSIQLIERVLLNSGMNQHMPLARDQSFDLNRWHDKLTSNSEANVNKQLETSDSANYPSRLWQQLAIDLMVSNMDSANWGWAHRGSVQYLEFWSQLDSDIRFVLVCEDRLSMICRLIEHGEQLSSMSGHLASWAHNHQQMLRFHLRNPAKSHLVWGEDVQSNPVKLIQHIENNWQTPLDTRLLAPNFNEPNSDLLKAIATQILNEEAQTATVDYELQSLIGPSSTLPVSGKIDASDLISLYGQLKERAVLQEQVHQAQKKIEESKELQRQDEEKIKLEIATKQESLNKLAVEQKSSAALKKQKDELIIAQKEALEKNKVLQEESDLLLMQLHQVQEELEKIFLTNQDAQGKIKLEIDSKQAALEKLETEKKNVAALKKQRDELTASQQDAQTKFKEIQKKYDLLLAQHQQVQGELEKRSLINVEVNEKIKLEIASKQDALNKLTAEQKNIGALKKQRDELNVAHQDILVKNKSLQEESDLLLAQLHQVQEELEKYFLLHKEKEIEVQKLQDRWLRAAQTYHELQDFEAIELLSESNTELTAQWRINQIKINGEVKGPFEFRTVIENGVTGFVFSKGAKAHSFLHRWPLVAAKENQLTVLPVKGKEDPLKRSATILQLATTDWQMVQLLTDKLAQEVGGEVMSKPLSHGQAFLEGIKAQRQMFEKVPALLRFDGIQLFGQQNTDLKTVMGLRLTQADLQGVRADPFEFQLQLNLSASSNMTSAHFIFDEKTANKPFENWTKNVKSSAGQDVMALQLSPKGWNSKVWRSLSPFDQQWLQNLVRILPFMFGTVQNQGVKLEKGWPIWSQATAELINWSQIPVDMPEFLEVAKDVSPGKLLPPDPAPMPLKAPRKTRQIKAKPAKSPKPPKPVVKAKVSKTSTHSNKRTSVPVKTKRRAS